MLRWGQGHLCKSQPEGQVPGPPKPNQHVSKCAPYSEHGNQDRANPEGDNRRLLI